MKPKLYRYQYISMTALFCLSGIFLPGILERSRGTASYPAFLPALPIGILIVWLLTAAFRGEGGFAAIAERRLGKLFGGVTAVVYILYFLLIAGELLCFYGLYISVGEAPIFYLAPISIAVMLAAEWGTTALGRTALIFAPLLLLFTLGLAATGIITGDFANFVPFTCLSWREIAEISLMIAALGMGQVAAVMAVSPAAVRTAKTTLPAVILPNILVLLIAAAAILIDGQTPLINRVKYFSPYASGDFSELKIVASFVLFFCTAFRLSVCLRAAAVTTAELMGRKEARYIIPAYAAVLLGLSTMLSGNIGVLAEYLLRYTPYVSALPLVILPLVLLVFRGKERRI